MARIWAVINQKGGVAKTTTAHAMVAGFALKKLKCLAVDLDAQTNFTDVLRTPAGVPTVVDVLLNGMDIHKAIGHSRDGFDILPASRALAGADTAITGKGKEFRVRDMLAKVAGEYDHIVIDTPPALGIITVNALAACDSVVIPAQADLFSLQGVERLGETVAAVREHCNPKLRIEGILLTRYVPRAILSRDLAEMALGIAAKLKTKVYRTFIREAIAVKEAQAVRQTIYAYAKTSNPAVDYWAFISELLGERKS